MHLEEFDRRRGYLEAGYGSLWDWCLRVLHLREGAAGRRIGAMKVVRRFPAIADAVREGRVCLSTVCLLGQVLTEDNFDDLVARAAFKTKAEVDHLVASVRPREAPKDGIRKLPSTGQPGDSGAVIAQPPPGSSPASMSSTVGLFSAVPVQATTATEPEPTQPQFTGPQPTGRVAIPAHESASPVGTAAAPPRSTERPHSEITAVCRDQWSVRVTIDGACKAELELLQDLLSHKCGRDLAAVVREAIRCGIEKHGKRRGAVRPSRPRAKGPDKTAPIEGSASVESHAPRDLSQRAGDPPRDHIPAAVRQAVYDRDRGCCSFVSADGKRCGSRWKLELDHVHSAFLDGPPTVDNVRLLCRAHNVLHAEQVFGREHMDRFRGTG